MEARHEREKTELKEKVTLLERELAKAQIAKLKHESKSTVDKRVAWRKRREAVVLAVSSLFAKLGNFLFRLKENWGLVHSMGLIGLVIIVGLFGLFIYHEFYDLRNGWVADRTHVPAHYETRFNTTCSGTGSNQHCYSTPYQQYVPDAYYVEIRADGREASWGVSETTYTNTEIGEWFCARDLFDDSPCPPPSSNYH